MLTTDLSLRLWGAKRRTLTPLLSSGMFLPISEDLRTDFEDDT